MQPGSSTVYGELNEKRGLSTPMAAASFHLHYLRMNRCDAPVGTHRQG
jgi:hypothetical protein